MGKFVAVVVPDEKKAYECLRAIEELHKEGDVTLFAADIVKRDEREGPDGTLSVVHQSDRGPAGMGVGTLVGSLIGLFGGPVGERLIVIIVTPSSRAIIACDGLADASMGV